MTDNLFRRVALALRSTVSDTYMLLDVADVVVPLIEQEVANVTPPKPDAIPHEILVRIAHLDPEVVRWMEAGKRISAIKALRALFITTGGSVSLVGLKAAKEACEDVSWQGIYDADNLVPQGDPWDLDEPPF